MDIGKILRNGWELFIRDIGPLIIGGLIAMVLSVLSLFILAGPLFGGLYLMVVRRVREGRPAEFGDVFACFDRFGTLFLAWWCAGLLILLGLVLLVVPGLLLMTIWVYLLPLIVDEGLGLGEAMSRSKEMVMKGGLGIHFAALLVVGILTAVAVQHHRRRRQPAHRALHHRFRGRPCTSWLWARASWSMRPAAWSHRAGGRQFRRRRRPPWPTTRRRRRRSPPPRRSPPQPRTGELRVRSPRSTSTAISRLTARSAAPRWMRPRSSAPSAPPR